MRGFSREIVTLLCWVISFWVSLHFCVSFSTNLQTLTANIHKRLAISFISLFISTLLAGSVLQQLLTTRIKQTYKHTAFMERLGGGITGIMQGVVITIMIVLLAGLTAMPRQSWWHESSLLPSIQILAIWLRDHVAMQMANAIYR